MSENVRKYGGSRKNVRKAGLRGYPVKPPRSLGRLREEAAKEALRPDLFGLGEVGKYGRGVELRAPQAGPAMLKPGLNYLSAAGPEPKVGVAVGVAGAVAGLDETLGDVLASLERLEDRLGPVMLPAGGGEVGKDVPRPVMSPLAFEITQRTDVVRGVRARLSTLIERLDI